MFCSVVIRGCVPVLMAYCSAGRPKASQPIGCSTFLPLHPLEAAEDVGGGVALRVADVQAGAARIREHVEHVELLAAAGGEFGVGERPGGVGRLERVVLVPPVLPSAARCPAQASRSTDGEAWSVLVVGEVVVVAHTDIPAYAARRTRHPGINLLDTPPR